MVKVAGIQMRSHKGKVEENREKAVHFARKAASQGAKLICLPELWVTGYGMDTDRFMQLSETVDGPTVSLFRQLAMELNVVFIVPFPERAENKFELGRESIFISAAVIDADGTICGVYRKSMLWGTERSTFSPGLKHYSVFNTEVGRVGVLICYDIEFPETARLLALDGADLIVAPSVWSFHAESRWDIQLPARALDNSLYVLGVNAVGEGACGKSKFISPNGAVLMEAPTTEERIIYGNVDKRELLQVRQEIPYMKDYPEDFIPIGKKEENEQIKGA
ncbi:nitrilase-related carbon-nitrogen hydrolase [Evansella sp. AB-P1]|uniref:nitrilase-related carbon-nitrogen hydrolase n=1 Tax=Evansella sp. AB-P1 TaxID=3037653 RepID=UPI00241D6799|nr:nitrilase-related carbon-nitrogen hydrolase [Evansella sp. AB-P1]MDG5787366.1 nitrilase-related carbon-nitrogen hydrolase [Evansella sp. AB-P1]